MESMHITASSIRQLSSFQWMDFVVCLHKHGAELPNDISYPDADSSSVLVITPSPLVATWAAEIPPDSVECKPATIVSFVSRTPTLENWAIKNVDPASFSVYRKVLEALGYKFRWIPNPGTTFIAACQLGDKGEFCFVDSIEKWVKVYDTFDDFLHRATQVLKSKSEKEMDVCAAFVSCVANKKAQKSS